MNWNELEKTWKGFAEANNTDLTYRERNIFHAIECTWRVTISYEFGKSIFVGTLWKSSSGHNKNKTKIVVDYSSGLAINDMEIKNEIGLKHLFSKSRKSKQESEILAFLKKIGGKSLTIKNNQLTLEIDHILETATEFDGVLQFIQNIQSET